MFTTDNRYVVGPGDVPDDAIVAYGARWIDHGDTARADIIPDRQGFAYNASGDMDPLIGFLMERKASSLHQGLDCDVVETVFDGTDDGFVLVLRRAGGYVYVSAWLQAVTE